MSSKKYLISDFFFFKEISSESFFRLRRLFAVSRICSDLVGTSRAFNMHLKASQVIKHPMF